jgi:hypothetical protein
MYSSEPVVRTHILERRSSSGGLASLLGIIVIFCLPFVHLGRSEFASVSFALFALVGGYLALVRFSYLARALIGPVGIAAAAAILFSIFRQDDPLFLTNLRELASIALLATLASSSSEVDEKCVRAFTLVSIGVAALAAVQTMDALFIHSGKFFIPGNYYNLDYGTLSAELYERYGSFSRPSATFSEPSSLGAFGLCVCFVAGVLKLRKLLLVGVTITILSASLSSLACLPIIILSFYGRLNKIQRLMVGVACVLGMSLLAARLSTVVSGEDASTMQRLYFPFRVLVEHWNILGLDQQRALMYASSLGAEKNIFDNFLLGKALLSGLYVIFVFGAFFRLFGWKFFILFCAFCMINGSPLYYDRFVMLSAVVFVVGRKVLPERHQGRAVRVATC